MNEKEQEKILNLNEKINKKENFDLGGILPQIFTLFGKELKPKLIACFESLDDFLFDLADKAETNQKQSLYFDSMRYIRKSRELIFKEFFQSIKAIFKLFKYNEYQYFVAGSEKKDDKKSLSMSSLSLIGERELDETLALTNLIKKSEMAYHQQLFALEKRFSVLASGTNLNLNQIPIAPHVMVNSYKKGIQSLEINVEIKLMMYKMFERSVMGQMNSIYQKINQLLAKNGIVPEINYNLTGNNSDTPSNPDLSHLLNLANQKPRSQQIPGNDPNNNNVMQPIADTNYEMINQLFKHNGDSQNDVRGMVNNIPVSNIDVGLMMNALSLLQGDLFKNIKINEQSDKTPTEIKDELIKQLHSLDSNTEGQIVRKQDEDTIDLVGMLFQFIVDDRNLPDAIQVILGKLQIPYLKIALQDRNLFADKANPARMLLDKMSLATVGWNEESDNKLMLINKIEDITKKILDIEKYSKEIFASLLNDFNKFTSRLKKKSDVVQKRTKEKSLGQDKIHQAKQVSAQLLVEKMTNKQMPLLIRDILLGEWSNVMILMYLRHPIKSKEYQEKVEFVEKVIAYSQKNIDQEINKEEILVLSKLYEKGLKLVAFNPKELIDKQDSLINCLNRIHQIDNENPSKNAIIEVIPPEEILELSQIRKEKHEIADYIEEIIEPQVIDETQIDSVAGKYTEIVINLKAGMWLEFEREDKKPIRAKLSWVSPITGKFLFVNSRGLKITDKTTLELSLGLKNNTIRVLEQIPIFDRALSAIASKLRKEEL